MSVKRDGQRQTYQSEIWWKVALRKIWMIWPTKKEIHLSDKVVSRPMSGSSLIGKETPILAVQTSVRNLTLAAYGIVQFQESLTHNIPESSENPSSLKRLLRKILVNPVHLLKPIKATGQHGTAKMNHYDPVKYKDKTFLIPVPDSFILGESDQTGDCVVCSVLKDSNNKKFVVHYDRKSIYELFLNWYEADQRIEMKKMSKK